MRETAARWYRVSSDKQDEANQAERVGAHMTRYDDSGIVYRVHAASAFHGEHAADMARMLADMAAGKFTVLVARHSDRIDREDKLREYLMLAAAAGGRFDFIDDPGSAALSDDLGSKISVLIASHQNNDYSRKISRNVRDSHRTIRANGGVTGKAPWGMTTAGEKYNRRFVATAEGQAVIPDMFMMCRDGASLAAICRWLEGKGIRPAAGAAVWSPKSVGQLIRNPAFMGRPQTGGKCKALVSPEIFKAAGEALDSRKYRRGDARAPKRPTAMLTGWLYCALCAGPMYRIKTWQGEGYRCSASPAFGASRRSECCHTIDLATADAMARGILAASTAPVMRQVWRDGDNTALELAELDADEAELMRQKMAKGISREAFMDKLEAIETARDALAKHEAVPGGMVSVPTGRTFGDLAAAATTDDDLRTLLRDAGGIFLAWRDQGQLTFADRGALLPGTGPAMFPGKRADDVMPAGYTFTSDSGEVIRAA